MGQAPQLAGIPTSMMSPIPSIQNHNVPSPYQHASAPPSSGPTVLLVANLDEQVILEDIDENSYSVFSPLILDFTLNFSAYYMWHTFHPFWRLRKCTKSKNSLQQERQRSAANGRQPSSYHWYKFSQEHSSIIVKPWPTWTVAFFMINPSELSSRNTNKSSCLRIITKHVFLRKISPTILCIGSKSLDQRISRSFFSQIISFLN